MKLNEFLPNGVSITEPLRRSELSKPSKYNNLVDTTLVPTLVEPYKISVCLCDELFNATNGMGAETEHTL